MTVLSSDRGREDGGEGGVVKDPQSVYREEVRADGQVDKALEHFY